MNNNKEEYETDPLPLHPFLNKENNFGKTCFLTFTSFQLSGKAINQIKLKIIRNHKKKKKRIIC